MDNGFGNENLVQMDYKSKIMGFYNNGILKKAIKMACLKYDKRVLDFGCSYQQQLEKFLPGHIEYIGFDVVKTWSDIEDYSKLKNVDVVFAMNVLEHFFSIEALRTALKNFKKIGAKKLIVALPAENYAEYLIRFLLAKQSEDFFAHTFKAKDVAVELSKELGMPSDYCEHWRLQILARFDL